MSRAQGKLIVVDFSAEWCGPCKFIAPTFEEYAKTYTDAVFIHVDIDTLEDLPDGADVRGVPTCTLTDRRCFVCFSRVSDL